MMVLIRSMVYGSLVGIVLFALATYLVGCGKGAIGPAGAQGPKGDVGLGGFGCSVQAVSPGLAAPAGGSLIVCGDGSQSLILNGVKGDTGGAGQSGQAGSPGTVVAAIQFCSGVGSYPTTFPELGFCISDHLYAVYSANGGFLTEVLPGTWSSNGIGSSCNFTVGEHCAVTR